MEIDGGLAVKAETEYGETLTPVSEPRLRELVHRIGGSGDRWLVMQRIPDVPDVFAQVWHEEGGGYQLEHRVGGDGLFGTRLTRAFETLNARGVTARENFTCCRTCGTAGIGAERAEGDRGFVYFHTQCTESAAAGHGLTLLYGGFGGSAGTTTAVGHEVVAALTTAGLSTQWDGNPDRAIEVTPLTWHKRLVG